MIPYLEDPSKIKRPDEGGIMVRSVQDMEEKILEKFSFLT